MEICHSSNSLPISANLATPLSFSPFLAKSFKVPKILGFVGDSVCFSPKHDMIIACPIGGTMKFYDATTFLPFNERETEEPHSTVQQISYHPEADTYLIGCRDGSIYLYNVSDHQLKKLKKCDNEIWTLTLVNSTPYAFSETNSKNLNIGTLGNKEMLSLDLKNCDIFSLQHLSRQKFLISGLDNGAVVIYRTDKLPCLPVFCSGQTHRDGVSIIQSMNVNGKEYIITGSCSERIKIWCLMKGRIRLLKVIYIGKGSLSSVIYLENYKMLAIACGSNAIMFYRFASGKLERKVFVSQKYANNLFLTKEKNMIGVRSEGGVSNVIEFIQLSCA